MGISPDILGVTGTSHRPGLMFGLVYSAAWTGVVRATAHSAIREMIFRFIGSSCGPAPDVSATVDDISRPMLSRPACPGRPETLYRPAVHRPGGRLVMA